MKLLPILGVAFLSTAASGQIINYLTPSQYKPFFDIGAHGSHGLVRRDDPAPACSQGSLNLDDDQGDDEGQPGQSGQDPQPTEPHTDIPPASDDMWEKSICKGRTLMKQMRANDHDAGQMLTPPLNSAESPFNGTWDLEAKLWGWKMRSYTNYNLGDDGLGLTDALKGLKLSTDPLAYAGRAWTHSEFVIQKGNAYKPTNGTFVSSINAKEGVIISLAKFSPAFMGRGLNPQITGSALTPLQKFSDVAYLQAHEWPDFKPSNIIYASIENEVVLAILARAIMTTANQLEKWPGTEFPAASTEGLAILGTPYGTGVSLLLFQHKKSLGTKVVDKVTVFQGNSKQVGRPSSLVFHIKDV